MALPIHVAAVQYPTDLESRAADQDRALHMMDGAAQTSDLILLPESSFTPSRFSEDIHRIAERIPGPIEAIVSQIATTRNAHICYNSIEQDGERYFNTSVLMSSDGALMGKQRKIHPTSAELNAGLSAGERLEAFDTSLGRMCILSGTDVLNVENIHTMQEFNTQLLLVPCLLRSSGHRALILSRWELALQVIARRSRCRVVWANKTGVEGGALLLGNSMVVDSDGAVLARGSADKDEVIRATVQIALGRPSSEANAA